MQDNLQSRKSNLSLLLIGVIYPLWGAILSISEFETKYLNLVGYFLVGIFAITLWLLQFYSSHIQKNMRYFRLIIYFCIVSHQIITSYFEISNLSQNSLPISMQNRLFLGECLGFFVCFSATCYLIYNQKLLQYYTIFSLLLSSSILSIPSSLQFKIIFAAAILTQIGVAFMVNTRKISSSLSEKRTLQKLKEQQDHLIIDARLSSLGQMATNIAQELNTPLTTIVMALKLIKAHIYRDPQTALKGIELIEKASHKAAQNIKSLKYFNHSKDEEVLDYYNLKDLIQSALEIETENIIQFAAKIDLNPNLSNYYIYTKQSQFIQVLLLLMNNSFESCMNIHAPHIKFDIVFSNQKIKIRIQDNGPGIKNDLQNKIFQKMYSTKSHQAGLGLNFVKAILNSQNADIHLLSSDSQTGTCFEIEIHGKYHETTMDQSIKAGA